MTNINDEVRLREGDTDQTYSNLYVDEDRRLHLLDSDGNDTNLMDGYNHITRSISVPITGGFDYDTNPIPEISLYSTLPYLMSGARLNGSYSSGTYQGFFSCTVSLPQDYSSGGEFKIYAVSTGTGDVYLELAAIATRLGDSASASSFGIGTTTNFSTAGTNIVFALPSLDMGEHNLNKGDLMSFRVYRYATNAGDTNTSDLYIIGAELFYNAETPKRNY